ncbi:MAG: DUF3516 domain-containing protein [Coriobacteriia bacterium]|nr:DUF3516 domain-containing protein [Coriobacteriia bacterium]
MSELNEADLCADSTIAGSQKGSQDGSQEETSLADTALDLAAADGEPDFQGFGGLGLLADSLWDAASDENPVDPDEALMAFIGWMEDRGIEVWPHQEEALMSLMMGNHVILGTPTGSGKSLVALGMHFKALCLGGGTSYYTAPIKALVSEKFFDLVQLLGRDYVGMITGDTTINPDAPVICCTAEVLANRALGEGPSADIGYVTMDEFHFYGDVDRGWAWQVPLIELTNAQFLLMSATLGDVTDIATSLTNRTGTDVDVVADAPRPIPLSYEYVDTAMEGTVELALRKGEAPIYVVHFSQDAALDSAQALASFGIAGKEERAAIKEACKGTSFSTAFGKTLQRLLGCGVGVHHAGMLPRYRLLVEKLAQQGLLPVICGTDTLGVGINVPIHTVLLTALIKFDGHRMRRLNAREFHQIAGRAGRSGFDTEGVVLVQAPEYEIENARMRAKAGNDPKKQRKLKLKRPPQGKVTWNKGAFERVVEASPETLKPRMRITNSMVVNLVERGGDARANLDDLIDASSQTPEEKAELHHRANEVFATLEAAGVVDHEVDEDGAPDYFVTLDMPEDFALDQPLSPFLLAALELLDPESDTYALDVISMAEATVENPRQVLRAQERRAKSRAMAEMKAEGIEYDERLERLEDITYPKPLEDELAEAFDLYCQSVPWAADYELLPKSVLREMVETGATFKSYVSAYNIARSEGTLLRYLSDVYRVLDRTIPADKRDERLCDIISWLSVVVRTVDSSLVDEWENAGGEDASAPQAEDAVVIDRRGLSVLVRNALFQRVRLAAADDADALGALDADWGFGVRRWRQELDGFYDAHEDILLDADARSTAYFFIDESDEKANHVWHVRQIFRDTDDDHDFQILADVDLDATQDGGDVVFKEYRAGFMDELLD